MKASLGLTIVGSLLGLALALAVATCTSASSTPHRSPPNPGLLHEAEGAITEIAMHYTPGFRDVVWSTYLDFWSAMDGEVSLNLLAPDTLSDSEKAAVLEEIGNVNPGLAKRTRWVGTPGPITTWSKDRALVLAASTSGPATLWVPEPPDRSWPARYNDWESTVALAASSGGRFERRVAPFDFDAGDFAVTDRHVIVGANLLAKNERRDIPNTGELRRRLSAWLDQPVLVLGERPDDVPDHHPAMTWTPLDGRTVLVGDPRLAEKIVGPGFVPGAESPETKTPLRADFSRETMARFDRVAKDLQRAGYSVVRIPNVPLDPKTYITYTNGVYETRNGQRTAYLPEYDIEPLDAEARAVHERLGYTVHPIRVAQVYRYHGTIGCLVNVVGRRR